MRPRRSDTALETLNLLRNRLHRAAFAHMLLQFGPNPAGSAELSRNRCSSSRTGVWLRRGLLFHANLLLVAHACPGSTSHFQLFAQLRLSHAPFGHVPIQCRLSASTSARLGPAGFESWQACLNFQGAPPVGKLARQLGAGLLGAGHFHFETARLGASSCAQLRFYPPLLWPLATVQQLSFEARRGHEGSPPRFGPGKFLPAFRQFIILLRQQDVEPIARPAGAPPALPEISSSAQKVPGRLVGRVGDLSGGSACSIARRRLFEA